MKLPLGTVGAQNVTIEIPPSYNNAVTTNKIHVPHGSTQQQNTVMLDTNGDGMVDRVVNVPPGHKAVDLTNDGVPNILSVMYGGPSPIATSMNNSMAGYGNGPTAAPSTSMYGAPPTY